MSLDTTYYVTDTDNRTDTETMLICQDENGNEVNVMVDPIELFTNMLENCYQDRDLEDFDDLSTLDDLRDLINSVRASIK